MFKPQVPNTKSQIQRINKIAIFNIIIFFFVSLLLLQSCENDIKKVNLVTSNKKSFPEETAKNIEITRTDSGKIVVTLTAPELQRFSQIENPYILFTKGLEATTYIHYPKVEARFSAKFAKYFEKNKLWEARNDVEAWNIKGEKLNTEEMFWDESKKNIYSTKFTRITSPDGVFFGENGFEADQNFTKWKLKNIKNSTINVKE